MKISKQRRMENKTNYKKRLILLKGNSPRLVVRKTGKYVYLQIIESKHAQDKVMHSINTKDLLEHGWPKEKSGSLKSLTASYLAGYLLGKKAKDVKERLVLDTGLIPNTKGSRIYAAVKGVSDAGLKINYDEKVIPSKDRLEGKHNKLDAIFNKVKGGIK
ncbi:MAG: 50S ribosomal protein L18 [Candidatus Nanoarchaeia archaeon]|nr:50S ribosomal protein L18 [Candidatus Nanoarchaeia archaeon]